MIANSIALMQACKRWACQQGQYCQVKWSAEVLEGQLVSAVWRSSVGYGCTLVCINCSCCSITARSTVFALASTRIRRLLRHRQAVRSVRRSCSLKIPAKISVLCNEADVCSSICCAWETLRTYSCRRRRLHASLRPVGVCGGCVDSSSWSVSMRLIVAFGRYVCWFEV